MSDFHTIEASGVSVTLDLRGGHVRDLAISRDGRTVRPLHTAPWVDDPAIANDETIVPNLRFLSGDFFCAPFGGSDVEPSPPHGWTANSRWQLVGTTKLDDGISATYRLEKKVLGATVEKTFTLRNDHPFLYETHAFIGGSGGIPVANHAMTRFPKGGRLSFSPKRRAETPEGASEPDPTRGRSALAYPARAEDPTRFPLANGGTADLTRYPFAQRHEDFLMLIEAEGSRLGWLAAVKPDSHEMFLTLKNPADFPVTALWFSNGGRDYAPWSGRHIGVLGMEEARAYIHHSHKAAIEPNAFTAEGIPTALELVPVGRVEVRNVIGGLPLDAGSDVVADIRPGEGAATILFADGKSMQVPFDSNFLHRAG